ncbi:MAG: polyprenyl synthetase family protein [Deltaproteobacteria bacterium]|nr:polyprenyl synthetase family protein [Deltaproteobacteria bacterium]
MDLKTYLVKKRALIDNALKAYLPEPEGPAAELIRAMNYSLFAGGKRLRPILCMAGAEAVGGDEQLALPVACALELIHTYSLIHDDLPAMDNDDLRRGKSTSHKVFGEAIAILAGDGLLTEAFHLMTRIDLPDKVDSRTLQEVIALIATAAGYQGMVGGQVIDIQTAGTEIEPSLVEFIHTHKTGALIAASVSSGAILGHGSKQQVEAVTSYGNSIGLAFQISDDILDVEGDSNEMGKGVGGDAQKGKNTYPSVHGIEKSKKILREIIEKAVEPLKQFDLRADPLRHIARYIIERKR